MQKEMLWEEYEITRSVDVRNELIEQYMRFVKFIAIQVNSQVQVPDGIEQDDLVQFGVFGLIKAIEDFNREKGGRFETYAAIRIRGTMQDYMRKQRKENGGMTRTVVNKTKEIELIVKKLEIEFKRSPKPFEVAEEMGLTVEEYHRKINSLHRGNPISLDKQIGSDENLTAMEMISNDKVQTPEAEYIEQEQLKLLDEAIKELPSNERMVIELRHVQEYTLNKIGKMLNLSEPRISQLRKQALKRLEAKNIL